MNDVSVKERLKNLRKSSGKTLNELLILYGIERLLYRLSISEYRDQFVLKGGALLYTLLENKARVTRDIDVLARQIHNSRDYIQEIMGSVCQIDVDDALRFDLESILVEDIAEDDDYHGVRFMIIAYLGKAKICLQIDIGFSDVIYPEPREIEYPSLLELETPKLLGYPIEAVIAEKYEAMISLGIRNSRYKDFYDIMYLSQTYKIDGAILQQALVHTFQRRGTKFSMNIYQPEYLNDKEKFWDAFKRRINSDSAIHFDEVIKQIQKFLLPVQNACEQHEVFKLHWNCNDWNV